MLNSAGMDAQFERSCCAISRGILTQMAKEAGATEKLKMTDQLHWVGMMNAIKHQVEEIIWDNIIYR